MWTRQKLLCVTPVEPIDQAWLKYSKQSYSAVIVVVAWDSLLYHASAENSLHVHSSPLHISSGLHFACHTLEDVSDSSSRKQRRACANISDTAI